jgi:hypothetical protein
MEKWNSEGGRQRESTVALYLMERVALGHFSVETVGGTKKPARLRQAGKIQTEPKCSGRFALPAAVPDCTDEGEATEDRGVG